MRTRVTKQSRHKNKQKTKTNNKTKDRDGNPKGSDTLYPLSIYQESLTLLFHQNCLDKLLSYPINRVDKEAPL